MKNLLERITRRGGERPPEAAAAPQETPEAGLPAGAQPTETQEAAPKPPSPLTYCFMLSHLEDDGPVRLDGVKLGVCEVMGLELDEPKLGAFAGALNALDFPIQLLVRPAPAAPGAPAGQAQRGPARGPAPADEGGGRVASAPAHRPGGPRRHPRPALLRRERVLAHRRAARPAGEVRALRPPHAGPPPADVPPVRRSGRHPHRVRRGRTGRGRDQPPRHAHRRNPGALPAPGQVAPITGPRLPPEPHGRRNADGPVRPPGADSRRAGGPHPGVAEGQVRVGPVPLLQARPHHVTGGGDRPGGRDPAPRRGAARAASGSSTRPCPSPSTPRTRRPSRR